MHNVVTIFINNASEPHPQSTERWLLACTKLS